MASRRFFAGSVSKYTFWDLWLGIDNSRDNMYPGIVSESWLPFFAFSCFLCITVHGVVIKGETGNLICPNETVGQLSWIEELFYLIIETEKYTGFLLRELRV